MAEMPHYCSACGEVHGGSTAKNPEIEIARINAERDIKVAEMNRGEFKPTAAELETRVEVAQIEADAEVGAAEAIGDALAPETEAGPAVIEDPPSVEELEELEAEEEGEPEPPEVTSSPTPAEPKRATHWGAYR
jgi:hypothetical protein